MDHVSSAMAAVPPLGRPSLGQSSLPSQQYHQNGPQPNYFSRARQNNPDLFRGMVFYVEEDRSMQERCISRLIGRIRSNGGKVYHRHSDPDITHILLGRGRSGIPSLFQLPFGSFEMHNPARPTPEELIARYGCLKIPEDNRWIQAKKVILNARWVEDCLDQGVLLGIKATQVHSVDPYVPRSPRRGFQPVKRERSLSPLRRPPQDFTNSNSLTYLSRGNAQSSSSHTEPTSALARFFPLEKDVRRAKTPIPPIRLSTTALYTPSLTGSLDTSSGEQLSPVSLPPSTNATTAHHTTVQSACFNIGHRPLVQPSTVPNKTAPTVSYSVSTHPIMPENHTPPNLDSLASSSLFGTPLRLPPSSSCAFLSDLHKTNQTILHAMEHRGKPVDIQGDVSMESDMDICLDGGSVTGQAKADTDEVIKPASLEAKFDKGQRLSTHASSLLDFGEAVTIAPTTQVTNPVGLVGESPSRIIFTTAFGLAMSFFIFAEPSASTRLTLLIEKLGGGEVVELYSATYIVMDIPAEEGRIPACEGEEQIAAYLAERRSVRAVSQSWIDECCNGGQMVDPRKHQVAFDLTGIDLSRWATVGEDDGEEEEGEDRYPAEDERNDRHVDVGELESEPEIAPLRLRMVAKHRTDNSVPDRQSGGKLHDYVDSDEDEHSDLEDEYASWEDDQYDEESRRRAEKALAANDDEYEPEQTATTTGDNAHVGHRNLLHVRPGDKKDYRFLRGKLQEWLKIRRPSARDGFLAELDKKVPGKISWIGFFVKYRPAFHKDLPALAKLKGVRYKMK